MYFSKREDTQHKIKSFFSAKTPAGFPSQLSAGHKINPIPIHPPHLQIHHYLAVGKWAGGTAQRGLDELFSFLDGRRRISIKSFLLVNDRADNWEDHLNFIREECAEVIIRTVLLSP